MICKKAIEDRREGSEGWYNVVLKLISGHFTSLGEASRLLIYEDTAAILLRIISIP
jgi:hypothetical protein